jgi:hypothetical protein
VKYEIGHLLQQTARGLRFVYQLTAVDDYTTKRGFASKPLSWCSTCAVCGQEFTVRSGRRPKGLPRTCPQHRGQFRRSTIRVNATRGACWKSERRGVAIAGGLMRRFFSYGMNSMEIKPVIGYFQISDWFQS